MTQTNLRRGHRSVLTATGRHRLARVTRWRPGTIEVPISRLLQGGQNGMTANEFAAVMGDPLWPSRRVVDGPHVDLLRRAAAAGPGGLSDAQIVASDYGRMAIACVRRTGNYFEAVDEQGVVRQAHRFLARAAGARTEVVVGHQHSDPGQPVLAVPIEFSRCFRVLDGHHRVALLAAKGVQSVTVRVRRGAVRTPLQEMLQQMSWLQGGRELYQPITAPEVATWPTVRRCTDRLASMRALVTRLDLPEDDATYLDVASCYGWFVAKMAGLGFDAEGMERDPLGAQIGMMFYDLDPTRIRLGDAVPLLRSADRRWDVVSCFSLLHHFVLGRGECTDVELVQALDRVTGRVLFLDTGQEHERWFQKSLRGWNPDRIRDFLVENTSFDDVIDLGPDQDGVGRYRGNYGRHLFACIRA